MPVTVSTAPGTGRATSPTGSGVVELTNGHLVLGVLPPLGGRVVLLKTADGDNLLDSDPRHWAPPFPEPALETPFLPWNGRIIWVGPQSGFWSQQDLRPDRKADRAVWPPDPFNEAGRFEIVEKTPTRLRLRGAVSPVSGLALEHDYAIVGERTVRMTVTATNRRTTPVSWDLWPNTRVRPEGFPYVPLDADEPPRLDGPPVDATRLGPYPHEVRGGWLTLPPGLRPSPPQQKLWAKAYVHPPRGLITFFHGRHLLLIRADVVTKERLYPEQAFVEIYRGAGLSPADDILELEMHGPYETLAPGASMSFVQTFEVLDYTGEAGIKSHLARLARLEP